MANIATSLTHLEIPDGLPLVLSLAWERVVQEVMASDWADLTRVVLAWDWKPVREGETVRGWDCFPVPFGNNGTLLPRNRSGHTASN